MGLAPVLALTITTASPRQAFVEGWLAGWAFFVPLLRWLPYILTNWGILPLPLGALLLMALSGYLGLYWAAGSTLLAWLQVRFGINALWLAAPVWVTAELVRAHVLGGFPWGTLGYIPYRRIELIQSAAWGGVYAVSFLLVVVNSAVAWILVKRTCRAAAAAAGVAALTVSAALAVGAGSRTERGAATVPVAIVQGNIDQSVKWNPAFEQETLRIHADLTRTAAPGTRLVVWPEAAVPTYVRHRSRVSASLRDLARGVTVPLLVGALDVRREGRVLHYFNSAFLFSEQGIQASYDKLYLVPFGEYVPLKRLLFFVKPIAAREREYTAGREVVIFPLDGASFGTVICYEIIFPHLVRRFVADGAAFLVNMTNDAWFGDTAGALQHLSMVPLRAAENGVAVVRAANTGVSALVAPSGRIDAELGLHHRGFLRVDVPLAARRTFYTRFGDLFAYACAAATVVVFVIRLAVRHRR